MIKKDEKKEVKDVMVEHEADWIKTAGVDEGEYSQEDYTYYRQYAYLGAKGGRSRRVRRERALNHVFRSSAAKRRRRMSL